MGNSPLTSLWVQSRQRKQGIDALGTTAGPVAAQAAQERAALDSASQKEGNSSEPIISKSLAAEMEARAAKMEGLLSTGGGFRVEAKNRLDLDADNNPVMMQYIQQRLAQMKGEDKPAFSPEKGAPDADDAYALPAAAAAALAEVQAAKKRQETAATPLMMNIGLAEVELPDTYKARNEQVSSAKLRRLTRLSPRIMPFDFKFNCCQLRLILQETKRAMQMHLMASASQSTAAA